MGIEAVRRQGVTTNYSQVDETSLASKTKLGVETKLDRDVFERTGLETNGRLIKAAPSAEVSRDLSLDRSSTLLRKLDDGRTALLVPNSQDMTHVEISVQNKAGSKRTFVVPKGEDMNTAVVLGRLAPGARVTITPLAKKEGAPDQRGVPLDLTWAPNAPASPAVTSVVDGVRKLAASGADEKTIAGRLSALMAEQKNWSQGDWAHLWGDAGTPSRKQMFDAVAALAREHPDLVIPGEVPHTLRELDAMGKKAEADWRDQIKNINR